jgi:hypothetical protein
MLINPFWHRGDVLASWSPLGQRLHRLGGCDPAHGLPTGSQPNGVCRTSRSRTAPFAQRGGSTSCGIGTLTRLSP